MQGELDAIDTARPIRLLGINEAGQESGNSVIVVGRTIPWLQDTESEDVWAKWKVTYRDVVVLDPENRVAGVYNLTEHDLNVPANYDSLKALLLRVAG
jgi:hypothetical protein